MKVAIVIYDLDVRGGTHKQVLRLCEYLNAQNVDFAIYTFYYEKEKTYAEFKNYEIHALFLSKQEMDNSLECSKSMIGKIQHKVKKINTDLAFLKMIPKDVDIINVHDMGFHLMMSMAKRLRRSKVVWQINDLPACFRVGNASNMPYEKKLEKQKKRFRRCAQGIDAITVNVTKNADLVRSCLGCEARVLYCGVDNNLSLVRHTYSIPKREVNLLSVGVFYPFRNYETLVETVKRLHSDGFPIHLNIIGATDRSIEYSKKILKLIENNKLDDVITVFGQVDERKYAELFNSADIFAFININQSWGLAVFEAMSAGLPTIVSNSVGAIELLHHDEDAIIVDPMNVDEICNVIKKLVSDPNYYDYISGNAYRAVKEYTWDNLYCSKMLEVFKGLENTK